MHGLSPQGFATFTAVFFLMALCSGTWRELHLIAFCATLFLSSLPLLIVINPPPPPEILGAVGDFLILAYGPMIGISAALFGRFIQSRTPPRWFPAIPMLAAILLGIFDPGDSKYPVPAAVTNLVAEIRRAGVAYAAADKGHAYTCAGPGLPALKGIQWWAESDFGTTEPNPGYVGKLRISLGCQAAAHPSWFVAEVGDFGDSAAWVRFDSKTGVTYQREY